MCTLGLAGVRAEMDFSNKSLKSQMKRANRLGAAYVLIVGEDELQQELAVLRNMRSKEQISVAFDEIVDKLKEIVSNS
jgi:histidyl-tRNA synthetase